MIDKNRMYYLAPLQLYLPNHSGVRKKVDAQIATFAKRGYQCNLITIKDNCYIRNNEEIAKNKQNSKLNRYRSINDQFYKIAYLEFKKRPSDVIYIRFGGLSCSLIRFCKKIKLQNNLTKILVEIPTYPFYNELNSLTQKIAYNLNLINVKSFGKLVDRVVTFSKDSTIFETPTICINNGFDVPSVNLKATTEFKDQLNLIAVGNLSKWHGYDRLLKGQVEYLKQQQKVNVNITFVGTGSEKENLEQMCIENNIQHSVKFVGYKDGDELNELFNNSHVALGSFGLHRLGIMANSSLKTREYCSRGIPFVLGVKDYDFSDDFIYSKEFPANESIISIQEIVHFYNSISKNSDVSDKMRDFASTNLTWDNQMSKVHEYVG